MYAAGWEHKRKFDGKVQDVEIWDTALDPASVKLLEPGNFGP